MAKGHTGRARAVTLAELLVAIAIVILLVGITAPALSGVRQNGADVRCAANLRQIASGLALYAQDHASHLPQRYYGSDATGQKIGYCEVILPYLDSGHTPANSDAAKRLYACPLQKPGHYPADPGYGMNYFYDNASLLAVAPTETILLAETAGPAGLGSRNADRDNGSNGKLDDTRHRGKANYAFFDGHVELLTYRETRQPLAGATVDRWGTDVGIHGLPMPSPPY